MTTHSPLAPSSAHRWVPCPGSVQLEAQYPETDEGESAAEGTAAHFAGSEELLGRDVREGQRADNGVVLTEEMLEGAALWVDDVMAVGCPAELQVEQRVAMPRIHAAAFGTPDTWFYDQTNGHLYVWDFKFGYGVVEAFENWQLMAYTCGILDLLGIDGRNDQHLWVHLRLVQPRAHHRDGRVREWKVLASDLRGYFNRLHDAAHEAMGPRPHTLSGPHCLHCKAAHACPTLKRATWSAADYLGGHVAEDLSADAAAYELVLLEHITELVKARKRAREADVEARLRRGEAVADWTLETTRGRTVFTEEGGKDVILMGDIYGVQLRKPEAPITPAQARKLLKSKNVDTSVIEQHTVTPTTGQRLVRDENLLTRARLEFGQKLES
ncbi:hypothetical protein Psm1vBMR14_gp39c [Pseudomonas phage MR14]|nr:hypothetical protein Psm1vBMR14_gp39c [Pseudomonas phage MR14]